MDITTDQNSKNTENNYAKTPDMSRSLSNQLTSITFETKDSNSESVWEIEKNTNCIELLNSVSCSNTIACNTNKEEKNVIVTAIFDYEQYKNSLASKKSNTPKVVELKQVYTPSKIVLIDTKHYQDVCGISKSEGICTNVDSFSKTGFNVDLNNDQCNLSSSLSCNSPLFPIIKHKKLNLRQLNAEIGDGKIVVFPKKNAESKNVESCFKYNSNMIANYLNYETNNIIEKNLLNSNSEDMGDMSIKNNINELSDINSKKHKKYFECNYDIREKIENKELQCPPNLQHTSQGILMRQLAVDVTDSSDSFILNLKEARAALSSNCKRRIEGTPHRSFLEFVCLEREVEQDQVCTPTNPIIMRNEPKRLIVANKMDITQNHHQFEKDVEEIDHKHKCHQTENIKYHKNYLTNTIIENSSIHKADPENLSQTVYETENSNDLNIENSLISSPIINTITNKRLTAELTHNVPLSKKRQTILFEDYAIDESSSIACTEKTDIIKEAFSELSSKDLTSLKSGKAIPTYDDTDEKIDVKQEQNETQPPENDNTREYKSSQQIDSHDMTSFQSRIPMLSNNNACKIDESGVIKRYALQFSDTGNPIIKLPLDVEDTPDEISIEPRDCKNIESVFEHNPITISDVSTHYCAKQNSVFNNEFIHLEPENSDMDDIEKTCLILVETLLSEKAEQSEMTEPYETESEEELKTLKTMESCRASLGYGKKIDELANVKNFILCQKCKHCKEVSSSESMLATTELFALPSIPSFPCLGFERLERLRKSARLKDVQEYWRRRSLEKKEYNLSTYPAERFDSYDEHNFEYPNVTHIKNEEGTFDVVKRIEKEINELKFFEKVETDIFFKSLTRMLGELLPNWILSCTLMARKIIHLSHKNFISLLIEMIYEDKARLGNDISIENIYVQSCRISSLPRKPIDYLLDFNLKINLPFDLKSLHSLNANEIFEHSFLQRIDGVFSKVLKDCLNVWRLLCNEQAVLIRETNRIIVRKITREVVYDGADHYPSVKNIEFQIELNNIQTVSFKDILCPPLYAFCEKVQFLPSGFDFLRTFLKSPSSFLR